MQGQFPQKIVLGHDPIQVLHLGLNPLPAQKSCIRDFDRNLESASSFKSPQAFATLFERYWLHF